MRLFLFLLFVTVAGLVGWQFWPHQEVIEYKTVKLKRGPLTEAVAVTANAEPRDIWYQNCELPAGIVAEVRVDYNEEVTPGQVLATLESEAQKMALENAKRNLEFAKGQIAMTVAKIAEAQHGIETAKSAHAYATQILERATGGQAKDVIPVVEREKASFGVEQSKLTIQNAQIKKQEAETAKAIAELAVKQAEGGVEAAELSLKKTVIRANRKGMIVNKNVKAGDIIGRPNISLTDAGSGAMFELAESFDRMRAVLKISEADLSRVQVGQAATFKVDAYLNEKFPAKVVQIRNSPTNDRTAVTYPCVLEFTNKKDAKGEWMIRPRLTLNVDIIIQEKTNVLLVPNAALIYLPSNSKEAIPQVNSEKNERLVWVVGPESKPVPRVIQSGITNGEVTEIVKSDLKEGDEVILSEPPPAKPRFKIPSIN